MILLVWKKKTKKKNRLYNLPILQTDIWGGKKNSVKEMKNTRATWK